MALTCCNELLYFTPILGTALTAGATYQHLIDASVRSNVLKSMSIIFIVSRAHVVQVDLHRKSKKATIIDF